jgi:autoinducer 2-degrading protein
MHVTLVHIRVVPERIDMFIDATRANHEASIHERGNLRFDVLRSVEEPDAFVIYEAYVDEAAARAHKETAHYLEWRDTVAGWMAEPRRGIRFDGLLPQVPSSDAES